MARPTKLTPELRDRICAFLRAGNYVETAAAAAGISKETLYKWLRRGARSKGGPCRDFADAVAVAQAQAEARDVALIARAAESQWQAAAWRLERRLPARWSRRERHEHSGKDGGAIDARVDTTDLAAVERRIRELLGESGAAGGAEPDEAGGAAATD